MKQIPIIVEDKQKKVKVKKEPKSKKAKYKSIIQKIKEKGVIVSYFLVMIMLILFFHKLIQWNYYRDNTQIKTRSVQKKASYEDVNNYLKNYDVTKYYYWDILKVKKIETDGFLKVKVTKTQEKDLYSREN